MAEKDLRENPFRDEIYDYFLAHGYVAGQKSDYDVVKKKSGASSNISPPSGTVNIPLKYGIA